MLSTTPHRHVSRLRSSKCVTLPNSRRAANTALLPRHSDFDQLFDFLLELLPDFFGEILLQAAALKQLPDEDHGFTDARTRVMPSSMRSKLETCSFRCAGPAAVMCKFGRGDWQRMCPTPPSPIPVSTCAGARDSESLLRSAPNHRKFA